MAQITLPTTFGAVRGALNDTGLRKNRYGATQAPGAGNNAAEGYEIGSRWTLHHHRRALDPDRADGKDERGMISAPPAQRRPSRVRIARRARLCPGRPVPIG